ncbi:MAG: hypothetical protein U9Q80_11845 [Bacillota bacterium]|nr:hypothetical protein [Bacillota bacterium]
MKQSRLMILFLLMVIITIMAVWIKNDTKSTNITVDDREINYVFRSKGSNFENYSETEIFRLLLEKNETVEYIKLGRTITIEFDYDFDTGEMTDYILNDDGTFKYDSKTTKTSEMSVDNGLYSFILDKNIAVYLSSNIEDYKDGAVIRGFKLTYPCEGEMKEYFFVINTDAEIEDN